MSVEHPGHFDRIECSHYLTTFPCRNVFVMELGRTDEFEYVFVFTLSNRRHSSDVKEESRRAALRHAVVNNMP